MRQGIVLLIVLLSACTMRKETATDHVVHRGEHAVLQVAGSEKAYMALAQADAHALSKAVDRADAAKIRELADSGKVLIVTNPTSVRVINEAFNERQIEVTAGPVEGKIGWVPYEWLKPKVH